jgi:hypothetical protein
VIVTKYRPGVTGVVLSLSAMSGISLAKHAERIINEINNRAARLNIDLPPCVAAPGASNP